MKSTIEDIERWATEKPQREDTVCSPHGKASCSRPLAADVYVSDNGSPRIHWTVCQAWLDNEPDVAAWDHRQNS